MKKVELLSPAGNMDALEYAVKSGCDAVYLGGKKFGARAFSNNFENEEIKNAIDYCHLHGVKVYVTINTIIYDDEIDDLLNYVEFLYINNVDAIILQDYGVIDLIHQTFPSLTLHASTQMNVHTIEELKVMKKMGFKRVVLAREVDINTIKKMKKEVDIELEVFVHGALCISSSGQCYMSYMIGGRSANRGECAGICRQKYSLHKNASKINLKDEYLLSTKDLCLIDKIDELISIGIDSFKIEGRMKSKEYVKAVTLAYRKAIDKKDYKLEKENMFKIFNRGFTLGNIYNKKGKDFINGYRPNNMGFLLGEVIDYKNNKVTIKLTTELNQFDGIRFIGKEDYGFIVNKMYKNNLLINKANKNEIINLNVNKKIDIGTKVYKTLDKKLIDDLNSLDYYRKVEIFGDFKVENNNIYFTISDKINEQKFIIKNVIQKAKNRPVTEKDIKEKLSKLHSTPYVFKSLKIDIPSNIFINMTVLNNLRRDFIEFLSFKRIEKNKIKKEKYIYKDKKRKIEDFNYIFYVKTEEQLTYILNNSNYECYVSDYDLYNKYKCDRVIFKDSRIFSKNIDNSLAGKISSVKKDSIIDVYLNVVNSYAVNYFHRLGLKRVTLSYEMNLEQIKNLYNTYLKNYKEKPNLEVIIYGKPEVMISKYCMLNTYLPSSNCNLCKGKDKYYLVDKFSNKYKIIKSNDCYMRLLDYKNINLIDKIKELKKIGINRLRIVLDEEKINELENIFRQIL